MPLVGSKAVKAATPAVAALIAGGAEYELLPYEHRAGEHAFGDEAVRALAGSGLAPEQIFKTLLISLDRGSDLAVAVIPVPATLAWPPRPRWVVRRRQWPTPRRQNAAPVTWSVGSLRSGNASSFPP